MKTEEASRSAYAGVVREAPGLETLVVTSLGNTNHAHTALIGISEKMRL